MLKENTRPGKGSTRNNETRHRRRRQTCEKIESELSSGFLSSSSILCFSLSVMRSQRRIGTTLACFSPQMGGWDSNHLLLIASRTPASCRFLADTLQDRWRQFNGDTKQTRGNPYVACLTKHKCLKVKRLGPRQMSPWVHSRGNVSKIVPDLSIHSYDILGFKICCKNKSNSKPEILSFNPCTWTQLLC